MENSRKLAKTWPYPRHREHENHLRIVATAWFDQKSFITHGKYRYILSNYEDWANNIILPEVAEYIRNRRQGFPLHKYIHHGLSSQAKLFNLIGPLIIRNDLEPLRQTLVDKGIAVPDVLSSAEFEYEDRTIFNEDAGQPTSIDLVLYGNQKRPSLFIEAKLAEMEFGGCSVFASGDCDGRSPVKSFGLCYLHHIGRRYWSLMEKYGFLEGAIGRNATCIFSTYYQFFRELLLALECDGIFVLLSDERNPAFDCDGPQGRRGLMPFLYEMVPIMHQKRIASISIQEIVVQIEKSKGHEWVGEFKKKYGL